MGDFMKKAKDFVDRNEQKVDQGMRKAGDEVNRRTGGKYEDKVNKATQQAQRATGRQSQQGQQAPPATGNRGQQQAG
ncbi:antitoxin [Plantactinospora siamensis]|uniref:Antitoxin n=1 Tax=Plantactinospora siamensis TaxID=555372 RepID=A0ABV6NU52_9ACTN